MTATTISRPPTEADILDAIVRATLAVSGARAASLDPVDVASILRVG